MINKEFPRQKLASSKKGEEWGKQCVEGAFELACNTLPLIRQDYTNKRENYDLFNDIMDTRNMSKIISPAGLNLSSFPATMQNYPLINPKLKLLLGEEIKRRFEWRVICTNPDNFTIKEDKMKESLMQYINEALQAGEQDQEVIKRRLQEIQKYYKYDYQDFREKISSEILKFYFQEQEMQRKFNEGFLDALISADEIYRVDIIAGEPKLIKCDPLRIWTYGNGLSPYIDDADIIVEDVYASLGSVIDEFYDDLTESEIKSLEDQCNYMRTQGNNYEGNGKVNYQFRTPTIYTSAFSETPISWEVDRFSSTGEYFDNNGNVRLIRSTWKSKRKKGILKYYDEEGMPQKMIVDENYKINEQYGEEITWIWTNEYWEGVRIGKDIYKRIRPKPLQFQSINNLSECKSGYIGTYYNTNSSRARSLFDQLKPYQYLFNIFMYRTELAFAKYKGPQIVLPSTLIPNNWDMEKWMTYAESLGYLIINPFNEIMEGPNKGELAYQANAFQPNIISDDTVATYINANIQMLAYIEEQVGNISGVTKQRQGQIEQRELVGNTERAVTQSSHITEPWFSIHEYTKLRAMQTFLEAAKFCIKHKTDKRYYHILDEASIKLIESDPTDVSDANLAIFVTSSSKYIEFEMAIKQLAHAAMQNQMIGFKEIIDIYQSESITEMAKIMENAEELKKQQQEAMEKAQRDHEMQMLQTQQELEQARLQREIEAREDQQMHELALLKIGEEEKRKTEILKSQLSNDPQIVNSELNLKVLEMQEKLRIQADEHNRDQKRKDEEHQTNKEYTKFEMEMARKKQEREDQRKQEELKHNKNYDKEQLKTDKTKTEKEKQLKEKELKEKMALELKYLELEKKKIEQEIQLKEKEMQQELEQAQKEGELELQLMKQEHALAMELKKHEMSINKEVANVKGEEAKKQAQIKTQQSKKPNNPSK
jgi:hypothetical protein